ncbi:MAG TPA: 30S ribosomal protein S21 [Thermodesulfobacteriota bacterium]|nr:30S ribosomal protein S21 [Thermodesulfobacteriota bacterium]
MTTFKVEDSFEKAVKKFGRSTEREGLFKERRRGESFIKPSTIRRRKRCESEGRNKSHNGRR